MVKMKFLGKILLIINILIITLFAKDNNINIRINKSTIYMKETFKLKVTFKYNLTKEISDVKIYKYDFTNFNIISESKLKITSDKNYAYGSYEYILSPKKHGNFIIKPFKVLLVKKLPQTIFSNSINIKVLALPSNIKLLGDYNISASIKELPNGIVNLIITTIGKSYTKLDSKNNKIKIKNVRIFQDNTNLICKKENSLYNCKKVVSYSLLSDNNFKIPSIKFIYLDMKTKMITTKKTKQQYIYKNSVKSKEESKINITLKKVNKKVNKKTTTKLSKETIFYVFLLIILLLIFSFILILIFQYKKKIKNQKSEIVLYIESIISKEEFYIFISKYFGLNINLDEQIILLKYNNSTLDESKNNIINIIEKENLITLYLNKKYKEEELITPLTLDDKINIFNTSNEYKVDRNSIINVDDKNNYKSDKRLDYLELIKELVENDNIDENTLFRDDLQFDDIDIFDLNINLEERLGLDEFNDKFEKISELLDYLEKVTQN